MLNSSGEVIGIVSRSIDGDSGSSGSGWATWLAALPSLPAWMPTLSRRQPDWRRAWCVIADKPWHFAKAFHNEEDARAYAGLIGEGHEARFGSWQVGTDNFLSASSHEAA